MEQTPYTNFWKEEPENQRKAWRPTDESRRRLQMFGLIQFLLLGAIVALGMMIAKETKRVPRIFAQLPDGLVFETTESHPYIPRVAAHGSSSTIPSRCSTIRRAPTTTLGA